MAIISPQDHLLDDGRTILGKTYVGVVTENDDSKAKDGLKLGRVRVMIDELFKGIDAATLPWAPVLRRVQNGAKQDISTFYVPDVGNKVVVQFINGDIYSPMVIGEFVGSQTGFSETQGVVFGD